MRSTISIILVSTVVSVLSACSAPQAPNSSQATLDTSSQQKFLLAGSRIMQPANVAQPDVHTGTSAQGAGGW